MIGGSTQEPRFIGWRILVLATILAGASAPGQTIGVSSFVDPMIDDLGITRNALSAAYLVGTLLAAGFAPWIGRALDYYGIRRSTLVILVAFIGAVAYMGSVRNVVMLAIGFTFIRLLGQGALTLASSNAVSLWFDRRLGLANGIKGTASGLLMAGAPILFTVLINASGWRWAWLFIAVGVGAVTVPIAVWGLIDKPSDVGQVPDGTSAATESGGYRQTDRGSYSVAEATRAPAFWLLISVSATAGALSTGLIFQHASIMEEAGLDESQAAGVFLPMAVAIAVSAVVVGVLVDRLSSRALIPFAMSALGAALAVGPLVDPGASAWGYGALLGIVGGATQTISATLLPRWFGVDNQGVLRGIAHVAGGGASAVGPLMVSLGQSIGGSYRPALRWYVLIPAAVAVASVVIGPPRAADG